MASSVRMRATRRLAAGHAGAAQPREAAPPARQVAHEHVMSVPIASGERQVGMLVAVAATPFARDAEQQLQHVAARLADDGRERPARAAAPCDPSRELLRALTDDDGEDVERWAREAHVNLRLAHVPIGGEPADRGRSATGTARWPERGTELLAALRRAWPGSVGAVADGRLRALAPCRGDPRDLAALDAQLAALGAAHAVALGRAEPRRGVPGARTGLAESSDAARVASALVRGGGLLAYDRIGAYRYLLRVAATGVPEDPLTLAARAIEAYDRRRGGQLLETLERYLADRRPATETARALMVHPNTLRQRLQRIEAVAGIELASVDLLALELAVKLVRLDPRRG